MTRFVITSGVVSDVGVVRSHNEDSYLIRPPVFAVADGMGGHAAGEVASRLAVESLSGSPLNEASEDEAIRAALVAANRLVFESAAGETRGMGTTCALLLVGESVAHLANVGDSRIYRLRGDTLEQLTRDHTLVAEMIDQGLLSVAQAMRDGGSQITRALGGAATVEPDVTSVELQAADRFLICSDGLSGMVNDERIRSILLSENDPRRAAQLLVNAANGAGGEDNVTVLIVNIDAASQPPPSPQSGRGRGRLTSVLLMLVVVVVVIAVALVIRTYL